MAGSLHEYNRKRHFDKTKEPEGEAAKNSSRRLRFVVQHHVASRDHYEFRLEWDGALKSWAVPKGPSYSSHDKRLAVQVEDHPLAYRDFEGTIPKGQYGGGAVMVWDEGIWYPLGDAASGLAEGSLKFTLEGDRLKGRWALVRMKPKPGEKDNNWLLIKEKDEYENIFDVGQFATSIKTGRTMAEIEAGEAEEMKEAAPRAEARKKTPAGGKQAPEDFELEGVTITHPEKVLYEKAGITKGDVADYYRRVSGRMLPYLENRILSTVRCPGGIGSACFYKKHPTGQHGGLVAVEVPSDKGGKAGAEEYYAITDVRGLLFEVQMNTLEFHPWGSRVDSLENPDTMVFDLDPDEGMELAQIRRGVKDLKGILDQLPLTAFLKTSGGKGYHIVIPFRPAASWEHFHDFAQNIAKTMEAMWPDRYTSNVRKSQRKGRIFIDWIRNGRGATSVAPYSVRAREGAPVSMPIAWKELETVAPQGVNMEEALARLRRKDPWEGFFEIDQQLK